MRSSKLSKGSCSEFEAIGPRADAVRTPTPDADPTSTTITTELHRHDVVLMLSKWLQNVTKALRLMMVGLASLEATMGVAKVMEIVRCGNTENQGCHVCVYI